MEPDARQASVSAPLTARGLAMNPCVHQTWWHIQTSVSYRKRCVYNRGALPLWVLCSTGTVGRGFQQLDLSAVSFNLSCSCSLTPLPSDRLMNLINNRGLANFKMMETMLYYIYIKGANISPSREEYEVNKIVASIKASFHLSNPREWLLSGILLP